VRRFHQEVVAILKSAEVSETLFQGGVEVGLAAPDELRNLVRTDLERYRQVVNAAGLRAE